MSGSAMRPYRFSMGDAFDLAKTIVGMDGWEPYRWQLADGDGHIVNGCKPSGYYTRGERKGQPKFRPATPGTERMVAISKRDLEARAAAYEAETGKCWDCKGEGQTWAGWSSEAGHKHRTCARCEGSTRARAGAAE